MRLPLAIVALFLIITACSSQPDTIKVGVIVPLTGEFGFAGPNMARAAQFAIDDADKTGRVELIIEDAPCTGSAQAVSAARKLIEVDGVQAIIGGTCSGDTLAIAPIADENQVIYLTPVTGGKNIDDAGEYVFRIANSDVRAGEQPAEDLYGRFGYREVALITDNAEYTLDIRNTFRARFEALGGEIVMDETVPVDETDFRTLVIKLKEQDPDAVMISSQLGTTGGYLLKQMREGGLDIPVITTFTTVVNENNKAMAGDILEGVSFYDAAYDTASFSALNARYETEFGAPSPIPFHAAASYDSMTLILQAIDAAGYDGAAMHDWLLSNVKGWSGQMGTLSLDEKGNSDAGFTLKVVRDGEYVEP